MSLKSNIFAAGLMSAFIIAGGAATAMAGPVNLAGAASVATDGIVVKVHKRYKKRHAHRRHRHHRRYARRYRRDCCVEAPYTYVDSYRGDVEVDAPYAYVTRSHRGVHVRAPFVNIYVPRY